MIRNIDLEDRPKIQGKCLPCLPRKPISSTSFCSSTHLDSATVGLRGLFDKPIFLPECICIAQLVS